MTNLVLVVEGNDPDRTETAWIRAVESIGQGRDVNVRLLDVADGWPAQAADLGPLEEVTAVVWFVKFRHLLAKPSFDWGRFRGLRVLLDHDAFMNWGWQWGSYEGEWNRVFARDHFDLLVTSSKVATERFLLEGVRAEWLPKSYDAQRVRDLGLPRTGVGHFGTLYPARRAMLAAADRAGVHIQHVTAPNSELNQVLNRYSACVVCNLDGTWNRWLRRLFPSRPALWFTPRPGIEVMFKNFEVAASGAALICDRIADLEPLGFRDGESMIGYSTFDELVDRLRIVSNEDFRRIGASGANLALERHSHERRAEDFFDLIERMR